MPWKPSHRRLFGVVWLEAIVWTYCDRTPINHRSQSWLILTATTRCISTRHANYQVSLAAVVLSIPFQLPITLRTSWPSRRTVPAHGISLRVTDFTLQPITTAVSLPVLRIPNRIPPLYTNHHKALVINEVYRYQHYIWTDRLRRRYAIGWSLTHRKRCELKHGTAFCN